MYRDRLLIRTTPNLSCIDSAAPRGSLLTYHVSAVDAAGNIGPTSTTVTVVTPQGCGVVPSRDELLASDAVAVG